MKINLFNDSKKGRAKIKKARRLMHIYINVYGLNHIKTVRASQRLDTLLNKYPTVFMNNNSDHCYQVFTKNNTLTINNN